MKMKTIGVLFLSAVLLTAGAWTAAFREDSPLIGTSAPDFTLKDYDGNQVSLASLRGKVVFVVFWFPT